LHWLRWGRLAKKSKEKQLGWGMGKIIIERAHGRGLEAARAEAEALAEDLAEKFGLKYRWSDDTLEFKGSGAKGQMCCSADEISLSMELSFVLRPFKTRIEQEIHKYLDQFASK
jgi:putative polyhydroxyalkanoate system protein